MIPRFFTGESYPLRGRFSSHISIHGHKLFQCRGFIKIPRIFERRNPDLVSKSKINLHDHSSGFINFINSLDSLISSNNVSTEAFIDLFEKFESSLSDDSDHIVNTLGSYDTISLLFLLDSLTIYTQTKTSKNITNFLNNVCSVLSSRDLIKSENDQFDITYNMALMDVLNRINHESQQVKSLIASVNRQLRVNMDALLQNGIFTHFMNLFSYTFDPSSIYTIVYCCMFELDKFKHTDYSNLPEFLFKFKIFDDNILSNVVLHASSSVCSTFGSDSRSFSKFVKGLLLFEDVYNNNDISFSPSVLYLNKLKANLTKCTDEELLFLLSSLPSERYFVGSLKNVLEELVVPILVRIGILSDSREFNSISHLSNSQLMDFVRYVNKLELKTSGLEWKHVKSLLLKGKEGFYEQDSWHKFGEASFLNEFAKDLSNRFLKEVPQNCKLSDVDDVFKLPASLSRIMLLLNRFYIHNVDEIYLNSLSLSLNRLLSLLEDYDFEESEIIKLMNEVSKVNIRFLTDFSRRLFSLGNRNNLELLEKALRFKLLYLNRNNSVSETREMIALFNSFEPLRERMNYKSVLTLLNLLDIVIKTEHLSDDSYKEELDICFEKFSVMVYDFMKSEFRLFNFNSMTLLLNLPLDCKLLSEMDNLTDIVVETAKIPQLVAIFIYKLKRVHSGKQGLESAKKVHDVLILRLEELVNLLDSNFGQRIWLTEPTNNNNIKKINPWMNEHGMRVLFKKPREYLDVFLYEKCPKIEEFFHMGRYSHSNEDEYEDKRPIDSLNDLKMELIDLSRKIVSQEMEVASKEERDEECNTKELASRIGSELRRATLAVEMCRPISRDYHLPKKHTEQLIKLSHKKFSNLRMETQSNI